MVSMAGRTPGYFYPRPPRGGRPLLVDEEGRLKEFLSTPSARRATGRIRPLPQHLRISIHALREEGDRRALTRQRSSWPFLSTPSARRATLFAVMLTMLEPISIHALREEGDDGFPLLFRPQAEFLSTPSARRATPCACCPLDRCGYFYPRPPRGGRRGHPHA